MLSVQIGEKKLFLLIVIVVNVAIFLLEIINMQLGQVPVSF